MSETAYDRAIAAARFIETRAGSRTARVAVVLGSGLGGVAGIVEDPAEIPYTEIPHFVRSTVDGHEGKLIVGGVNGVTVAVMKGRFHFYEGYTLDEVAFPIRVFAVMGIRALIITNAAGGADPQIPPGSLMAITDHLNLMGDNPLRGPNDARFGPRFPDMTDVYTPVYLEYLHEAARELRIKLVEGIYAGVRGPTYETPAEVRMLRTLGADAVGMSTVPEAIVAHHCGINVLGVSCVTNTAAGLTSGRIDHEDVIRVGRRAERDLASLIELVIPRLV
jgi:purine-nucleoside phosphorylase